MLREDRAFIHREHDDLGVRRLRAQLADHFDVRRARHTQVEHQHLRSLVVDVAPGRGHVPRFGDHVNVLLTVEQQPQAASHHRVVIG